MHALFWIHLGIVDIFGNSKQHTSIYKTGSTNCTYIIKLWTHVATCRTSIFLYTISVTNLRTNDVVLHNIDGTMYSVTRRRRVLQL